MENRTRTPPGSNQDIRKYRSWNEFPINWQNERNQTMSRQVYIYVTISQSVIVFIIPIVPRFVVCPAKTIKAFTSSRNLSQEEKTAPEHHWCIVIPAWPELNSTTRYWNSGQANNSGSTGNRAKCVHAYYLR